MNEQLPAKKDTETELAPASTHDLEKACLAYYAETAAAGIAGDLLAFRKGVWQRGAAKDTVPAGLQLVANVPSLLRGWTRWENNVPAEHRMVPLGEHPPLRNELCHLDTEAWEEDANGNPKDPWAMTDRLVLRDANLLRYLHEPPRHRRRHFAIVGELDRGRLGVA